MRRGIVLVVVSILAVTGAHAVSVKSWSVSSGREFLQGTMEGTALDAEGRVVLAPSAKQIWGPAEGIVWDAESDGKGGAFIALSSPTRVLHVAPGREPEIWHDAGDEGLVAALLPDGEGGVYVGVSPDGRLFHVRAAGVSEPVADTEALFIWALAKSADGAVWIGTGLPGRLLRLEPDGTLNVVFESGDDPVRSIVPLAEGGVAIGTGGRGRVIRVDENGPFVLLDADEAEIVALETDVQGRLYALAARGSKQIAAAKSAAARSASATVRVTATAPPPADPNGAEEEDDDEPGARLPDQAPSKRLRMLPGGVLYRIDADGGQRKIWTSRNEVPFGLARGPGDTMLVATGDSGRIYAIDERGRSSMVIEIPSDQASSLSRAPDGTILVGGTTDARLVSIETALSPVGSYAGPVHDAGAVADWGRVNWEADRPSGSEVRVSVRAGNTAEPDETWTDWRPIGGSSGSKAGLPASRWVQVRVELEPSRRGKSPQLRRLELFYLPRNRRPTIDEVVVQPAGVVWSRSTAQTRPVGPVVATDSVVRRTVAGLRPKSTAKPVRKNYELGARTVSWKATDPDGDRLTYRVEIRAEGSSTWVPLAVDLTHPFFGWDARSMPDGLYRVRLHAEDALDNAEGRQLSDQQSSAAFRVDNTRPSVGSPQIRRGSDRYEVEFVALDPGGILASAEAAVDAGEWQLLEPTDGVADSAEEHYLLVIEPAVSGDPERSRTVRVRVTDSAGNMGGNAWPLDDPR